MSSSFRLHRPVHFAPDRRTHERHVAWPHRFQASITCTGRRLSIEVGEVDRLLRDIKGHPKIFVARVNTRPVLIGCLGVKRVHSATVQAQILGHPIEPAGRSHKGKVNLLTWTLRSGPSTRAISWICIVRIRACEGGCLAMTSLPEPNRRSSCWCRTGAQKR